MIRTIRDRDNPIDSLDEALAALYVNWGDHRTEAVLFRDRPRGDMPYIDRQGFCGPYDSYSGARRFFVTQQVAEQLFNDGLVLGKPCWGYTDHRECRLSDRAQKLAFEASEKQKATLSTPGEAESEESGG